jgi:hypothetical protein
MGNQKLGFLHGVRERESGERIQVDGETLSAMSSGRLRFPTAPMAVPLLFTAPGSPPRGLVASQKLSPAQRSPCLPWPAGSARLHRSRSPLWGLLGRIRTSA